MKIYTKTGDKGETGLIGGTRISKADQRIVAYGTVDEINSNIGLAISLLGPKQDIFSDLIQVLTGIQNDLFLVGSDLADPDYPESRYGTRRISENMVTKLEATIDRFESELTPITFFILPGGSTEASLLHVCRSVSRRAETEVVALSKTARINPVIVMYLNRLSDLFFVSARLANKRQNVPDIAWAKDQP